MLVGIVSKGLAGNPLDNQRSEPSTIVGIRGYCSRFKGLDRLEHA